MNFLDEYKIVKTFADATFEADDLKFLEYTGRKAFYSQGYYGQNTVCAVIDSGVSPHIEFEDRILEGRNTLQSYNNKTKWQDDRGHGTHVASSIAGKNVGIAPQAKILPVKVLDATGGTNRVMDIIDGIIWARNWRSEKGEQVDVISMSLSGTKASFGNYLDRFESEINKCVEEGIAVICSMGNTGINEVRVPAGFENVIAVGAVDIEKKQAKFTTIGDHVDVCQVGVDVIGANYTGGYVSLSGTSMSTPIVSGIACLLACRHKIKFRERITERKLYEQLKMNTKDLGIKGVDRIYGVGFCTLQPLNMTIETEVDSNIVKFNGEPITVDVPSRIENGRFLFEMRSFAERTGAFIDWEPENEYHKTRAKFSW